MNSEGIAKLAGVSRATVSRVINGNPNVAEKTRRKIKQIIDEYGYTPNVSAQNLVGKSNKIIGLFIADLSERDPENPWLAHHSPYFISFITSVIGEAKKYDYKVLVNIITKIDEYENLETDFKSKTISGGIFIGFDRDNFHLRSLAQKNYNVVFIDQEFHEEFEDKKVIMVSIDDVQGGYIATKHLIEKGHKRIAHIHGNIGRYSSIRRIEGYKKALNENGIIIDESIIKNGLYSEAGGYKAMKSLLNQEKRPTAVFAGNDQMAYGIRRAVQEEGLKMPDDISIIGYDNAPLGKYLEPPLTSIGVPLDRVANFSIKNLIDGINENENNKEFVFHVTLIERNSVKQI